MLSKRKALIGYGVYTVAKPMAKRAFRSKTTGLTRKSKILAALGAVGAGVAALLVRRRRGRTQQSLTT
jgi:LPXTG-motif cell wall-anchored protein